ncbi:hypothetical protein TUMSATVNIG1_59960 (plasmid) [Vibrio nigripulchritudo]|uniref:hypothetical protein n=1 Tax=Vibrio nigripulchritudo TaxID=28173 RepID=UPI00190A725B|nr:hypothetical protein [Vibrio nigripulchritudo]BCL74010.1 hypothetical protein VNTUMSATTG_59470 [Vibrio nigripulchritudo]BDU35387.1 hypothetical protein TUMSATVNIG1_59960 [Vibrio nigripulchritudo]
MIILLIIISSVMGMKPDPKPETYGITESGEFREIKPLSSIEINLTSARSWAEDCIIESVELSFIKPIRRVNKILNKCFTPKGKLSYQEWLTKGESDTYLELGRTGKLPVDSELAQIISDRITYSASKRAPGRIREIKPVIDEETGESIARWKLTLPLILKKEESKEGSGTGSAYAEVTLIRTNATDFPYGVGIGSFVIVPYKPR